MKTIAIFKSNESIGYIDALKGALIAANAQAKVNVYTYKDSPADVFDAKKHDLVILAGADQLPAAVQHAAEEYLDNKGRVLFLGGPAFNNVTFCHEGKWLTKDEYAKALIEKLPDDKKFLLYDTSDPDRKSVV